MLLGIIHLCSSKMAALSEYCCSGSDFHVLKFTLDNASSRAFHRRKITAVDVVSHVT